MLVQDILLILVLTEYPFLVIFLKMKTLFWMCMCWLSSSLVGGKLLITDNHGALRQGRETVSGRSKGVICLPATLFARA